MGHLPDPMGSSLLPLTRPPSWVISLSDVRQGANLSCCDGAASSDGANKDRAAGYSALDRIRGAGI